MTVVLGVDGGGTKTHAVVAEDTGKLLGVGTGGVANWENVGLEAAGAAVRSAVREALGGAGLEPGRLSGASFGLAGLDWPSDLSRLGVIIESLSIPAPWELVNDAFVALRAGANNPWGVVVVAGTGSVAAGRNAGGEEFRTLGLGPMYGDWGSATEIAEAGVKAVAEAFTGAGPRTSLSDAFRRSFGVDSEAGFLERVSRDGIALESLATPVLEAAEAGDAVARSISEQAGAALGASAGLVARTLRMDSSPVEVVLAGGVFRSQSRLLLQAFERELRRTAPQAVTVRLEVPPVVGAALRAMELAGLHPLGPVHLRLSLEVIKTLRYEFV